jgi:hypothetical protein
MIVIRLELGGRKNNYLISLMKMVLRGGIEPTTSPLPIKRPTVSHLISISYAMT